MEVRRIKINIDEEVPDSIFAVLIDSSVNLLRSFAPKATGNLAYNAIRVHKQGENVVKIYVDPAIAPYMVFTNEKWTSPKWNGKPNPNEKWFETSAELIARHITETLTGLNRGNNNGNN